MARPRRELPDFPPDWDNDSLPFHGFSKYALRRCYRPVLYLNGVQYYFGHCTTRGDAAKAYDFLLRFFVAFTPSRAVPNFPGTFFDIPPDAILAYQEDGGLSAKALLAIETKLTAEFTALGRSVDDYFKRRNEEILQLRNAPDATVVAREAARRRATNRIESLVAELARFPMIKTFVELEVTGDVNSLLVKDANEAFRQANQSLENARHHLTTLLEAVEATR